MYRRFTGRDYGGDAPSRRADREARGAAHALAVRTLHEWESLHRRDVRGRVQRLAEILEEPPPLIAPTATEEEP